MNKLQDDDATNPVRANGLADLFTLHRQELKRFLAARCGDPDQAEDLLQDLWIKLPAAAETPVANGRAYLFRMANNLVLDHARGRSRAMRRDRNWLDAEGHLDGPVEDRIDNARNAEQALAAAQEAEVLRKAIAELPPGAARALHLHRFEDMNQREVAEAMGISRSGVEKHLATAMKHLRRALADCGLFDPVESGKCGSNRKGAGQQDDGK